MFKKDDKRRVYWLLQEYTLNYINSIIFSNEFYYCYDLELNLDALTDEEHSSFHEISNIAGRFSEFEEDQKKHRGAFYTEQDLKQKVAETEMHLKQEQEDLLLSFAIDDKRKLYWLINLYLLKTIDYATFCNEFVACYNAVDTDLLNEIEYKAFAILNPIAGFLSPFKNDFKYASDIFYTEHNLRKAVIETNELLHSNIPTYKIGSF